MENKFEQIKKPEINIQELLNVVDNIKFEYGEKIYYNWTDFLLLLDTPEEAGTELASFHCSTEIKGFDIYIKETLSPGTKKRVLFHQILNANLIYHGINLDEAYNIAKEEEEKIFGSREIIKNIQSECFYLLN